jgi:hypothetical protein|tara:strand:+ start:242 stop:811 length:570 start_codon:yes stop_codon:yes gene_type:complete
MGRSGKSTLIDWVLNATNLIAADDGARVTAPTAATSVEGRDPSPSPSPSPTTLPRTTTTTAHVFGDNELVLVDTPDMLGLDGQTVVIDAVAEDRVAALVFVVDVTDHLRGVLAEELLHNTLKRFQAKSRQGLLVLIVGNRRHQKDTVLINIDTFPNFLPPDLKKQYTIHTMSFSNESDVTKLIQNMQPI